MNIVSYFDGISCGQLALEKANIEYNNYYAYEIDKHTIQITQKNYPKTIQMGSVIDADLSCLPKIDLLIGGSPCQDLSGLKQGDGLSGEKSKLIFEFIRAKRILNPTYFLLENVVPRKYEWKEAIDKLIGVEGVFINSDLFVEQNRPRYYWTNIPIAQLPQRPNWNGKYFQYRRTYFRENKSGVCPCLTANMGTGGHNVPLKAPDLKNKLTPEECELLQGIPYGYTQGISNAQRYKAIGNGWTIDVVAHIFGGI